MKHRIVTHTPFAVLGLQIATQPMSPEIPALWSRFVQREHEISRFAVPDVTYGVMQSGPGGMGDLRYLAGLAVAVQPEPLPAGMTVVAIPAGQYAVFEFPLSGIGPAFDFIFNTWLPASDYLVAQSPLFERYGKDFDPSAPSSVVEAHIPVVLRTDD